MGWKGGRRLGGDEVEICGLKVTLRAGFVGGVGRWESVDWVGRRGEASEVAMFAALPMSLVGGSMAQS